MANLTKLEFVALHSSGKNYFSWVLDAEINLDAMGLGDTIKIENKASKQDCAKAMIFLCHHIDKILKIEYLTVKDPLVLWNNLKERYDHLEMVIHPKARYDWMHLRLQDFKSIHEYNSAMFRITSQLKLCGDTGFKKYSELISHLLVAEQNNDLLMKNHENHENRPTGSTPFPEVNEVYAHHARRGRGRGRGRNCNQERNPFPGVNHSPKKNHYQKGKGKDEKHETVKTNNFRCGGKGHYACDYRTPKHLVELYQSSLRNKDKNPEANFITDHVDITHLDVPDFFTHPEGKIHHLIGDGSVDMEE
ncbi:uncharacterized protein LOC125869642 [Solanum stenotomum]|uniref:uncharacterized protein LOC125869642 n=1 Tax=Solanum stenotomum TaxID=172797 RepID=UPI0020D1333D|nr:uncharacterized protein LOC125869642 [Solanum stenotomum]